MTICDNIAKVTLVVGAIAVIVVYWNHVRPNIHGIKFEAGMCNYSHLTVDKKERSCSCGKSCTGYYPCLQLTGFFMVNKTENSTQSDFSGTFYKDYAALKAKCLVVPKCSRTFNTNSERVYNFFSEWVMPYYYTNSLYIPCYGRDKQMYFEMKYALWKAIVALAVPGGIFVVGVIITLTCSSKDHKDTVLAIIGLPFFIVVGIVTVIDEAFGIRECFRRCRERTADTVLAIIGLPFFIVVSIVTVIDEAFGIRQCFRRCRERTARRTPSPVSIIGVRSRSHSLELHHTDNRLNETRTRISSRRSSLELRRHSTTSLSSTSSHIINFSLQPSQRHYDATAPGYEPSAAPYNGCPSYGSPNFDPPPNYDNAGDTSVLPPPSYNDVMSGTSWRDSS